MKSKSTKTLQIITGVYSAFYIIAILSSYFEFRDSGPWILFGVPILLQGLFYLKNNPGLKTSPMTSH